MRSCILPTSMPGRKLLHSQASCFWGLRVELHNCWSLRLLRGYAIRSNCKMCLCLLRFKPGELPKEVQSAINDISTRVGTDLADGVSPI